MSGLGILAISGDPAWRARMQRIFALRPEVRWLGAHAPGQPHPASGGIPDLLLLDGDDPRVQRGRRRLDQPAPRRVYFYGKPDEAALRQCLRIGACGCLDKETAVDALLRAVRVAASGLFVLPPQLLCAMARQPQEVDAVEAGAAPGEGDEARWQGLTERQREIAVCLAQGMSNKQIARQLGISPETVKTHLKNAYEREGVHGRTALLAAMQHYAEAGRKSV